MSPLIGLKEQDTDASASVAGPVSRLRSRVASVLVVMFAALIGLVAPAYATTTDLTGGAGASFFDKITAYIQGPLGAAALTLFAIIVGFSVLMKWGGKVAHK